MIIYDDIINVLQPMGGISVLFSKIQKGLQRNGIDYKIVPSSAPYGRLSPVRYSRFLVSNEDDLLSNLFHSTYYRIPKGRNIKTVTTVHDFTHEKIIGGVRKLMLSHQKMRAIKRSDLIICVSNNTKLDLIEYLPNIDESSIRVIYNGVGPEFFPIARSEMDFRLRKDVIFIGRRAGYKNFDVLVSALSMIDGVGVCCVGGGKFTNKELGFLDRAIPGRYRHSGYLSVDELNKEYNKALCLVYPSSYEGFGIPIVEAMKAGCPVIAYKGSSIPEVAGDAAILLEHLNAEELAGAINRMCDESEWSMVRNKGLLRATKFSWEETVSRTLSAYEEVIGKRLGN